MLLVFFLLMHKYYFILFDSEIRAAVVIHMFGTWVEYESYKLRKMMNKRQGNPFILIKHVRAEMREDTGDCLPIQYISFFET